MGRKPKPAPPVHHDAEVEALYELWLEFGRPFGMTERDMRTKDGWPNLLAARALWHEHRLRIRFSGEEQGPDGWFVRLAEEEELELKSSSEERFLFNKRQDESTRLLKRLVGSSFLFIAMTGPFLSEVYYLPKPNPLNDYFRDRLMILTEGGEKRMKQVSLAQVKKLGALKLI